MPPSTGWFAVLVSTSNLWLRWDYQFYSRSCYNLIQYTTFDLLTKINEWQSTLKIGSSWWLWPMGRERLCTWGWIPGEVEGYWWYFPGWDSNYYQYGDLIILLWNSWETRGVWVWRIRVKWMTQMLLWMGASLLPFQICSSGLQARQFSSDII